jgi:hypothetical protein
MVDVFLTAGILAAKLMRIEHYKYPGNKSCIDQPCENH